MSGDEEIGAVLAVARQVPGWESAELTITRIHAGITNRNYRVDVTGGPSYVLRLPGERTELLGIDRANEQEAAVRAAELGIGPPVLGPLPGHATLVTELVPGATAADPAAFDAVLGSVVEAIRRFHDSGPLAGAFPIFRVVEWHARDAAACGVALPSAWEPLHEAARRIEAAFAAHSLPLAPCHNDLLPANVLIDSERVWILDFEYAGMNDCFFDLGNLAVNAGLDAVAEERVLTAYFGRTTPWHRARLALMKVMSELREGMWSVVQQGISTIDSFDFVAYATERLDHARELTASSGFGQLLEHAAAR